MERQARRLRKTSSHPISAVFGQGKNVPNIGDRLEEKRVFLRRHPEYTGHTGALISTVMSCERSQLKAPKMSFEAAHKHVFGTDGRGACIWCKRNFADTKRLQKKAFDQIPPLVAQYEC